MSFEDEMDDLFGNIVDEAYDNKGFFARKKKRIARWAQYGDDNNRPDVRQAAQEVDQIIDECIRLDEENEALSDANDQVEAENQQLEEEIKEKLQELQELEAEIEQELSEVDKELQAAREAQPPDAKKIAELEKKREELMQMKQECIADRKRLEAATQKCHKVSNKCKTISGKCNNVRNRGRANATGSDGPSQSMPFGSDRSDSECYGQARKKTPDERCDEYIEKIEDMKEDLTELKEFMAKEVGEIKELSAENTQDLKENKEEVHQVGQNINNRRERLQAMRGPGAQQKQEQTASATAASKVDVKPISGAAAEIGTQKNIEASAPVSKKKSEVPNNEQQAEKTQKFK